MAEQAREIGKPPLSIILEPVSRNTAPALTLAALALADPAAGLDDPVMLVLPADHVIRDLPPFQAAVRAGVALAAQGSLVTFGIVPGSPETGYGYVRKGPALDSAGEPVPFQVSAFVEKPDAAAAEAMVKSGAFLWNSGMFVMRASVWLGQIQKHRPDIAAACREAHASGNRDGDFLRPDKDDFEGCPADSVDYAVMERAAGEVSTPASVDCAVVPLDAGWSDIGAWSALWEDGARDTEGNVLVGDVHAESTTGSLLIGTHRLLAAVGLEDVIAVETPDRRIGGRQGQRTGRQGSRNRPQTGRPAGAGEPPSGTPPMGELRGRRQRARIPGEAPHR